jgi:site-specific recombinase XerD
MQLVNGPVDVPGAAHLVLAENVAFLDPAPAVFDGMLEGWARQQRVRFLKAETIARRDELVRRIAKFTSQYPWEWTAPDVEAFFDDLQSRERKLAFSTAKGYQDHLRLFLEYLTDERYGWAATCRERFGAAPRQLLDEWNTIVRVSTYIGNPRRRPLTYDEVQALFDAADGLVEEVRARGRKGGLTTQRDAALLKTIYAFGLRRREAEGLDLGDLRRNPDVPQFRRYGALFVRWGKSSRGNPPKRRTVMLVPEMEWVVPVLQQWLDEVRPLLNPGKHPALFITERRGRMSLRSINDAFTAARDAADLDPALDLHCLRHSYVTHLIEFDYPERFVQDQVGHEFASTTAIYTGVGDDYRNKLLVRALEAQQPGIWDAGPGARAR